VKISFACRAYTLVETLVAASILLLVVAAAAALSGALTLQEELAQRSVVALNYQEQAARLWQLGLAPAEIFGENGLLPPEPGVVDLEFNNADPAPSFPGLGPISQTECVLTFRLEDYPDDRVNRLVLVRSDRP
jgi:type II secretory pathway pseudopilin PulG